MRAAIPAPVAAAAAPVPSGAAPALAPSLRFEQLGVEQGLAQESVLAIVQDRQGFMWFGSQAGLSRYDGYRSITYRNELSNPASLADNWVRVLHVDRDGRLWAGTDGGLDRFDPATRSFIHYLPHEEPRRGNGNRHVRAIVDDGAGAFWIATGDGLQHFDPASGRFRVWHHAAGAPASLGDDEVNALAQDGSGRLWVGTASGLDALAPGAADFEHYGDSADIQNVQALLVDARQTLWIGAGRGLAQWPLKGGAAQRRRLGPAAGLPGSPVTAIYQDAAAHVWVGSFSDGLYRWQASRGRFKRYSHSPSDSHSLADNRISALYQDRSGTFWAGTWYRGVSRVDLGSGGFARIVALADAAPAPPDSRVRAIADDGHGGLWLGTNHGLNRFDPASGQVLAFRPAPGAASALNSQQVSALWRGAAGDLWIGGNKGINHLDPAGNSLGSVALSGPDAIIRGIMGDRDGMLWIGSRGGLHRLDPRSGSLKAFRHDPADSASLADNSVRPMLEDRHGGLWIGTFNGLDLLERKTGRFRHFRHDARDPHSLSHDEVHYLFEDRAGTLWVGTASGLNRMETGPDGAPRFRRYLRQDGIADDAIAAILDDDTGGLWLSSNSGISRLDTRSGQVRNYAGSDGTIEGAYFDGSAARGADGTLYFGGFNGVTAFAPAAIRANGVAPAVVITDLQIFNQSVRAGQGAHPDLLSRAIEDTAGVTLGERDSVFSFEFAALHYAAPQRNRFAYQLQGFDRDWVQTDASKRFATYTNLDPGRYVFRVKASNKDDVWNDDGATLAITILPPWWKTWWLRSLLAALLLGTAWGAFQVRTRAMRRQKSRLEQQVRLRTVEVEQKNRLLRQQKKELEQRRTEAERQATEAEQRRMESERQKEEVERQKENVEQAHRNIAVLSEIGRQMTATLDMETAMATLYHHVHDLMDARIFCIGFYREEQGLIEFPFSMEQGMRSAPYSRSLADPHQFAVWCLLRQRDVFVNDVEAEYPAYFGSAGMAILAPARSVMYTPLRIKERVLGVLGVHSIEKNAYCRVHLDMLVALAAHAAVGLDNARAYQEQEATMQALRAAQDRLQQQEKQGRLQADALALANHALQENDERLRLANQTLQENDEGLRLAKQKAEDATRQKSDFLATMSHEMRTPLAGVIGMLGFALRDTRLQDGTREQIQRGQSNAQALLAIINDLLDFSKIEAGKLAIEEIDFALAPALHDVAGLFREQARVQGLEWGIEFGAGLPPFVRGDPTRLHQVLVNLVGNAFKFTRRGAVTLRVERTERAGGGPAESGAISFSVSDSGIGIAPDALARLFQKFEQADSSTTRRYGGTGLGLAICRQLVELMGGRIDAVSSAGAGSTFTFVLPLADGAPPPPLVPAARASERNSHSLHVLCAEDFPTNQIIIRTLLEELGHRVDIAADGALAVAACARVRYDLVLMDGRMPDMDGASATRLIRAGGPPAAPVRDRGVRIVALTANASAEDRSRYLAAGMDDFLSKPIDAAALHAQLARSIERQLARGHALLPMPPPAAELDALFGVPAAAAQHAVAPLAQRLRRAFAGDAGARLAALAAALAARDSDAAGRLLHGIRGSAAYLGESELQHLAGELEAAADQGLWPLVDAGMPRLRQLLEQMATAEPG